MRAVLLHLDDALEPQTRLRAAVRAAGGLEIDARDLGPSLRLWSRPPALRALEARLARDLPATEGAALTFAGSGDFHHLTPALLTRALSAAAGPAVTLLHFDNHPDWVRFEPGAHCGSWVRWASRLPGVAKVVTLGVCSDISGRAARRADIEMVQAGRLEIYPLGAPGEPAEVEVAGRRWPTICGLGEAAFARRLGARIDTPAVYVTIDKDVLREEDAGTNWDQGRMSLESLMTLVGRLTAGRELIGADVVGDWSRPRYGGGALASLLKRGEAALDQPWRGPSAGAGAVNESANLRLLELFAGHAT